MVVLKHQTQVEETSRNLIVFAIFFFSFFFLSFFSFFSSSYFMEKDLKTEFAFL